MGHLRGSWLAALVLALTGGPARAQSTAGARRWLNPLPTGEALTALWGDAQVMVAVGDAGTILRSGDHGATWALADSGSSADLRAIWGSGPHDLWVVGAGGTILRSTDGGLHWQQPKAAPAAAGDLTGVWGSGPSDVYMSGGRGQVVRTHDGGRSFEIQRPLGETETDEQLTGVWGSAADDVYVVGDRGSLLASGDGGQHWVVRWKQTRRPVSGQTFPKGSKEPSIGGSSVASITGTGRGRLLTVQGGWVHTRKGSSGGGAAFYTPDGGVTGQRARITPPESRYSGYTPFHAAGDHGLYGVATFDTNLPSQPEAGLIVSGDGGATFQRRSPFPAGPSPSALWRDPAGPLIAVGSGGMILRSLDDGLTWQDRRTRPLGEALLRSIWSDGAREVWIVGDGCVALHSSDGGAHFEAKAPSCPAGEKTYLPSIWASGPDDVYVTGARVYHTGDRGQHWLEVTPTQSSTPDWRVWGSSADDLYAVGNGLWHSTDRARTWKLIRESHLADYAHQLRDVLGLARDDLFVVQTYGGFLHSSDGGATWEERPNSPKGWDCCRLTAAGAPDLYALGSNHLFLRSSDGARSWQPVRTPLGRYTRFDTLIRHGERLLVLATDGEDRGNHTALLSSLDHGLTWQIQSMLPYGCQGLAAIGDDLLVGGWEGKILRLAGAARSPRAPAAPGPEPPGRRPQFTQRPDAGAAAGW